MTILDLILGALCAFRLTQLVVLDTLLVPVTSWLQDRSRFLDELLRCAHCTGFWCSLATAAAVLFGQHWWPLRLALWGFGLAGAVSIIAHATGWLEEE